MRAAGVKRPSHAGKEKHRHRPLKSRYRCLSSQVFAAGVMQSGSTARAADGLAIVTIDKTGALDEIEGNLEPDFACLQEVNRDVRRRYDTHFQIAHGRRALQNAVRVEAGQMRVALEADADRHHCAVRPL